MSIVALAASVSLSACCVARCFALLSDISVWFDCYIRKNDIFLECEHRIGVRFHARTRCHTEETGFGVNGPHTTVLPQTNPSDIVAHHLALQWGEEQANRNSKGKKQSATEKYRAERRQKRGKEERGR